MSGASIRNPFAALGQLTRAEQLKAGLLSGWLFLTITTLWLLKPLRTASLLVHLGANELPYLRFGAALAVGVLVLVYSRIVNHLSRLNIVRGSSAIFAAVLVLFCVSLRLGGEVLASQRWAVWAVFILVDVYSTIMLAIFWTYSNDVVSRVEADRLYGPIGIGGILGGVAGGVMVDALVETIGPVGLLLVCAALVLLGGGLGWVLERLVRPPPRVIARQDKPALSDALEGAREVVKSRYLLCVVGIVVGYESAAAVTDFVINIIFERSFDTEVKIAQVYGRLGWIVSGTALVSQVLIVPVLLSMKRVALIVPPIAMALATVSLAVFPIVSLAIVLAASDRSLNYSLQQVTKESLYVPLTDVQRYKAKAFIDVFVNRSAKAMSSIPLLAIIAVWGMSIRACLALAFGSLVLWIIAANVLGRTYPGILGGPNKGSEPADVPHSHGS